MPNQSSLRREGWLQGTVIFLGITGLVAYASSKFTSGSLVVIITAVSLLGFVIALTVLAFRLKNLKRILKAMVLSLGAIIAGTYLILFLFVYFFQDTVANQTSSFFQPKAISIETASALTASDVLPLDLMTSEGIHLRGWLVRNAPAEKTPLLIYFGGSGPEAKKILWITRNEAGPRLEGGKLSAVGSATWLDQGKPWATFRLEDVAYNVDVQEYIRQKGK